MQKKPLTINAKFSDMAKFEKGNKIGHRFTSDNQPGNAGRKPKLKSIPKDAQERVYAALYHALTLESGEAAGLYLMKAAKDLPECGFLIQVYAKGLMGKNALGYASDIMDRLFGKAKQVSEIGFTKEVPVIVTSDERNALAKWARGEAEEKKESK